MNSKDITIHDKIFKPSISSEVIQKRVQEIAFELNSLNLDNVVIISVLNGSFMFTSDLCKFLNFNPFVSFIKVASYDGMSSTGVLKEVIGLDISLEGKNVIIVEDIIDSGKTIEDLYIQFQNMGAKEIFVVTLLFKPNAYKGKVSIAIKGFEIPNDFVVGYGMDYDGIGRNLKEIYVL